MLFYTRPMLDDSDRPERATLDLKLGRLLEARATGWAVLTVPLVLGLLLLALGLGVGLR